MPDPRQQRPARGRETVAVVHGAEPTDSSLSATASIWRAYPGVLVVLAGRAAMADPMYAGAAVEVFDGSLAAAVNHVSEERGCHVLVVTGPVRLPPHALDPATAIVEGDLRVATVSFFSDADGFLRFPRLDPGEMPESLGDDWEAVTGRLRTAPELDPACIPFASGPAVLLSAYGLSVVGGLSDLGSGAPDSVLADYSLRARARGLIDVVDPSTYTSLCGAGARGEAHGEVAASPGDGAGGLAGELAEESRSGRSPLSLVHVAARAKVCGLRILLDGSCLGPREMGTQVQTVALISALARRPDVARVHVALATDAPAYAEDALAHPKVSARVTPGADLSAFGVVDIAHQPFQPDGPLDLEAFRSVAARSVVTLLDLIAYHGRSYHASPAPWKAYRRRVERAAGEADGVVVPCDEVGAHVRLERLAVDDDRLFVVELGSNHLDGSEAAIVPDELADGARLSGDFVLVLGADYTHKNRDIAARVMKELRDRGLALSVVMAGATILEPERHSTASDSGIVLLPEVPSGARNWLLKHASLLLYPSSAEGFGLVPFEAARFGTPTVLVPFGPMSWFADTLPIVAADWSVAALADACQQVLADPVMAQAQVDAALATGQRLTWDATAAKLVDVYRALLARPARVVASVDERDRLAATSDELARTRALLEGLRVEHEELRTAHEQMRDSRAFRTASRLWAVRNSLGK